MHTQGARSSPTRALYRCNNSVSLPHIPIRQSVAANRTQPPTRALRVNSPGRTQKRKTRNQRRRLPRLRAETNRRACFTPYMAPIICASATISVTERPDQRSITITIAHTNAKHNPPQNNPPQKKPAPRNGTTPGCGRKRRSKDIASLVYGHDHLCVNYTG